MRPPKRILLILPLFLLLALLPTRSAAADIGPKPGMEFSFVQEVAGEPLSITAGGMLECQKSDCSDAKLLVEGGPQGFHCDAKSCSAVAYGFAPYHRIEIQFSDGKTRRSNIFASGGFSSNYQVTIRQDDLLVKDLSSGLDIFSTASYLLLCACCLSILAVVIVAIVLIARRNAKKK